LLEREEEGAAMTIEDGLGDPADNVEWVAKPVKILADSAAAPVSPPRDLASREEADIAVSLGRDLAALERPLTEGATALSKRLFRDLGLPLPGAWTGVAPELPPRGFAATIFELTVASGEVPEGHGFVRVPSGTLGAIGLSEPPLARRFAGTTCEDGAFAPEDARPRLASAGVAFEAPVAGILFVLEAEIRRRAAEFVGIQETANLLAACRLSLPVLVKVVVPKLLPLWALGEILQRLVQQDVPIRPMRAILESLARWGQIEKDPASLAEYVRHDRKEQISSRFAQAPREMKVVLVDPQIEGAIRSAIQHTAQGSWLALDPDTARKILAATRDTLGKLPGASPRPIILTAVDVRRYLKKVIELDQPHVLVLSYQEISPLLQVQPIARITLQRPLAPAPAPEPAPAPAPEPPPAPPSPPPGYGRMIAEVVTPPGGPAVTGVEICTRAKGSQLVSLSPGQVVEIDVSLDTAKVCCLVPEYAPIVLRPEFQDGVFRTTLAFTSGGLVLGVLRKPDGSPAHGRIYSTACSDGCYDQSRDAHADDAGRFAIRLPAGKQLLLAAPYPWEREPVEGASVEIDVPEGGEVRDVELVGAPLLAPLFPLPPSPPGCGRIVAKVIAPGAARDLGVEALYDGGGIRAFHGGIFAGGTAHVLEVPLDAPWLGFHVADCVPVAVSNPPFRDGVFETTLVFSRGALVSGVVRRADGSRITSADVWSEAVPKLVHVTSVDSGGQFAIRVPAGKQRLQAESPDRLGGSTEIDAPEGGEVRGVEIVLAPLVVAPATSEQSLAAEPAPTTGPSAPELPPGSGRVVAKVMTPPDGKAITNLHLQTSSGSGLDAQPDGHGIFEFSPVSLGTEWLSFLDRDQAPLTVDNPAFRDGVCELTLAFSSGGLVLGTLREADGTPCRRQFRARLLPRGEELDVGQPDDAGQFAVRLPAGRQRILAVVEHWGGEADLGGERRGESADIDVPEGGEVKDVEIVLAPVRTAPAPLWRDRCLGRAVVKAILPSESPWLDLRVQHEGVGIAYSQIYPDGTAMITGIPLDAASLCFEAPGFAPLVVTAPVFRDGILETTLTFSRGGLVTGVVLGADGRRATDVRISSSQAPNGYHSRSNRAGQFALRLPAGKQRLYAEVSGFIGVSAEIAVPEGGDVRGVEIVLHQPPECGHFAS
jgi:uncharacterized protein YuzE